jgi:hypothetical protein
MNLNRLRDPHYLVKTAATNILRNAEVWDPSTLSLSGSGGGHSDSTTESRVALLETTVVALTSDAASLESLVNDIRLPTYLTKTSAFATLPNSLVFDPSTLTDQNADRVFQAFSSTGETNVYWLSTQVGGSEEASTGTIALNRLHFWPFVVGRRSWLRGVRSYITTGGAVGAIMRIGVYNARDDADGWKPQTKLWESGSVSLTSVANVYVAETCESLYLDPGVYFYAFDIGVSSPTFSRSSKNGNPVWIYHNRTVGTHAIGWGTAHTALDTLPTVTPTHLSFETLAAPINFWLYLLKP